MHSPGPQVPQENVPPQKDAEVKALLLAAFARAAGLDPSSLRPTYMRAQLWGAAVPMNVASSPCVLDAGAGLVQRRGLPPHARPLHAWLQQLRDQNLTDVSTTSFLRTPEVGCHQGQSLCARNSTGTTASALVAEVLRSRVEPAVEGGAPLSSCHGGDRSHSRTCLVSPRVPCLLRPAGARRPWLMHASTPPASNIRDMMMRLSAS